MQNTVSLAKIINELLIDYDKHLLPKENGVDVTIELHVQGVSGISEITGDFEVDFMYSEIWHDDRLRFRDRLFNNSTVCFTNITLKHDFRAQIWTPDTSIINSKDSKVHSSPTENAYIILYEDGKIWSNFR
uniref:Neur_chan_LBD domain-containing protein n=1 Tax=Syphacia muris TaxID=451379 RepID=A0A0N5AJD5_9BILA